MGIEISGNSARPPQEALTAANKAPATPHQGTATPAAGGARTGGSGADQVQLSNTASQLQALEASIANLPVVDTRRVQDVQQALATGSHQVHPAEVADKLLTFEAGLGPER